ncbi:TetR/AcrR family transcriptional regulator [Nonomuraea deserti]|uniref:TetR/AcrR family transcriptional regulator n=1 Tax=Nonomuraea deserti TaxID=1848322 RepID=UPI001C6FF74D|nr:TetR family transcriptional regulator [Nonomuraea deserti]
MCSAPSADLTAQARIRNAAITHFARDGFQKTNLRAVAATAGVSAALVIRHFGSKDDLRAVCDDHVLQILVRRTRTVADLAGVHLLTREYLSDSEEYRLHVQYMVRAIEEDTPAATTFVNTLVEETEQLFRAGMANGSMRPSSDVRAMAVVSVLLSLATLTMAPPLTRALGYERMGPDVLQRIGLPMLELYTHGMYADDTMLKAAETVRETRRGDDL